MNRPRISRLAAAGVLALATAACGSEPVSPLPVDAPPRAVAFSAPPSAPASRPAPSRPAPSRKACLGAVETDLDAQEERFAPSLCISVGGVLRLRNLGPGLLDTSPDSLVEGFYEAGVHSIQFVRPGTVTLRFPQGEDEHTVELTVVVRK
ncbi:hypothetical protein AB0J80_17930 [Actinoplanes sp. NPDC049548]|uniref:hypothetical protein n=1 Tax=Actinoplanes sp. NPDC049548 TaxID=3155152 RepID=UPI00344AEF79